MTALTGQSLSNLDEFKLRLGHLSLLCDAAVNDGRSLYRLEQGLKVRLTLPRQIDDEDHDRVGFYLSRKKLCEEVRDGKKVKPTNPRYPDITVEKGEDGKFKIEPSETGDIPEIWFQDYCLSDPRVSSRTGATTVTGKSGSKTGLSHIIDWGVELGLISKSGQPSSLTSIIAHQVGSSDVLDQINNPYFLGSERIAIAYAYFNADFDVFQQLIQFLAEQNGWISRDDARAIYVETIERLVRTVEESSRVPTKISNQIYSLWRDIDKAAKRARKDVAKTSTAWHRASSRFETLTDLGLLKKIGSEEDHRYEYRYLVDDSLRLAAASLSQNESASEWLEDNTVSAVYGYEHPEAKFEKPQLLSALVDALKPIRRPTSPLPMSSLAISVSIQMANSDVFVPLSKIKKTVRELAMERPDAVKLTKGVTIQSEGMVSIYPTKL